MKLFVEPVERYPFMGNGSIKWQHSNGAVAKVGFATAFLYLMHFVRFAVSQRRSAHDVFECFAKMIGGVKAGG